MDQVIWRGTRRRNRFRRGDVPHCKRLLAQARREDVAEVESAFCEESRSSRPRVRLLAALVDWRQTLAYRVDCLTCGSLCAFPVPGRAAPTLCPRCGT